MSVTDLALMSALKSIASDLERLRVTPVMPDVLGAMAHAFRLNPPLKESVIEEFEAKHRCALPTDYRHFLLHIGNGGAGPYWGLFKLGETDNGDGHAKWAENDGFIGTLSQPFPHTGPWNDLVGKPEIQDQDIERYDTELDSFDEKYFAAARMNGAIPICHLGCALRQWLVVTGPEAGNIWCDDRADYRGLRPLERDGMRRVSFLKWYRQWLDEALTKL